MALLFFAYMAIVADHVYLARSAFLMDALVDALMKRLRLDGRSVVMC